MAPLTSDPRHLLVVLNPARRKALYTLIREIASYMRAQLQLSEHSSSSHPGPSNTSASTSQPPAELIRVRQAALSHFDAYRRDLLLKLKDLLSSQGDNTILASRRLRAEQQAHTPSPGESLIDFGTPPPPAAADEARRHAEAVARLQALYHPIPTRLTTIPLQDRKETLSAILLVLLSDGHYSAEDRTLAVYLASALELPLSVLVQEETEIAVSLLESSRKGEADMSADAEAQKRREQNASSRFWKVGLASVAGAAVIGVTGGLAAPVVAGAIGGLMGTVGLGGVASFLGIFWMNGALVGTLFGAFGATMTGEMVDQYAREIEDFRFIPLKDEWGKDARKDEPEIRRLKVIIGINGWLNSKEDVTKPWRSLGHDSEVFALRYEMDRLLELGNSLEGLVSSYAWSMVKAEILKRTVLATLWSAMWPAYMLTVATNLDNPFSLAKNRSERAGKILADALINRVQGERPVTLIGYSLGARAIYSCLRTLAERRAFGLVESVVFIGAPIPSNRTHWQVMRSVVSGKMFNVFSENDYILAFLYRATSIQLGVAGLQEIKDIEGVENLDLTEEVQGHLRYSGLIGNVLVRCGFPDISGTDGAIEKDGDDQISLLDSDLGRMGTLIGLDDLKSIPGPDTNDRLAKPQIKDVVTGIPPSVKMSPERKKSRSTVLRTQSETVLGDFSPLGTPTDPLTQVKSSPEPARGPPDVSKFVMEDSNTKYGGSVRDFALNKPQTSSGGPPAYTPSVSEVSHVQYTPPSTVQGSDRGDDSEEEEESYGGINMVDNDEDFAYLEPAPIED